MTYIFSGDKVLHPAPVCQVVHGCHLCWGILIFLFFQANQTLKTSLFTGSFVMILPYSGIWFRTLKQEKHTVCVPKWIVITIAAILFVSLNNLYLERTVWPTTYIGILHVAVWKQEAFFKCWEEQKQKYVG